MFHIKHFANKIIQIIYTITKYQVWVTHLVLFRYNNYYILSAYRFCFAIKICFKSILFTKSLIFSNKSNNYWYLRKTNLTFHELIFCGQNILFLYGLIIMKTLWINLFNIIKYQNIQSLRCLIIELEPSDVLLFWYFFDYTSIRTNIYFGDYPFKTSSHISSWIKRTCLRILINVIEIIKYHPKQ